MTPRFQKFLLLAHIIFSVSWIGAVVAYLVLAIAGLASHDAQMMRATYLSMELIGWYVLVPLSFAALATGIIQALSTQWGLFRYWWVLTKFLLTIVATVILLRHMQETSRMSAMMTDPSMPGFRKMWIHHLVHPAGGLLVLLVVTVLSVFKPWGMTSYGRRQSERKQP